MNDSPRPVGASATEMTQLLLPSHANAIGTAFGGTILSWIDVCAAIAAQRHCGQVAVTAAIDEMQFLAPVCVGDVVRLQGVVHAVFGTSLEVGVTVERERPLAGTHRVERTLCADAILIFVNRDTTGRPVQAPPALAQTDEEKRREAAALRRRRARRGS